MSKIIPKGIIPAMVTPVNENEEVNEKTLRELVNHLIEGGVHGLFPIGSQGEFYALSSEQKKRVAEIVLAEADGRVPVFIGTGSITTRRSIALTKMAEQIGADGVSVITPYFINPNESELFEHYSEIAKSTKLPVILYNNPGRTGGVCLNTGLVRKLSQIDNIVGIKDSSGDLSLTGEFITNTDSSFAVLAGRDTLIYASLTYGAKGSITATANVAPALAVRIYEEYQKGNHQKALEAQRKLAPLRQAFTFGTFPVVVKEALNLIGIEAGPAIKPVREMDPSKHKKLQSVLRNLSLL